jgi:ribonuclease HI
VEDLLTRTNICILNNKSPTHLHCANGSLSAIDLSLADASLVPDYTWKVLEDTYGSDHFPILLESFSQCDRDKRQFWKFNKADWTTFQQMCELSISEEVTKGPTPIEDFVKLLVEAADASIPKTSISQKQTTKPWFTDECKEAVKDRKKALKEVKRHPCQRSIESFRIRRAKARQIIRKNQRTSWQSFVSKLNSSTPSKKVWDMISKIQGKHKPPVIKHLKTPSGYTSSTKEIADTIASTVAHNSSNEHYSSTFQNHKRQTEKRPIKFLDDTSKPYNLPFTIEELQNALQKSHDTAAGPDEVPYQLLKQLPESTATLLLQIFNTYWENDTFPEIWRHATIVPIPKPGKDDTDPSSYRPIALTSCICKVMERMINNRLMWYLETNGLISPAQSGFRKQRSCMDHVVRLETFIREGFAQKQHVVAIFFDLEKAYDTTWKYGILKDLKDIGLEGHLPRFIQNFLQDRTFRVQVGKTLSDLFEQEAGVPQGSILSTTLFNLKINNIAKLCSQSAECFLYVDDFVICYRASSMHTIERQLQLILNKLQDWVDKNGFKFSTSKTTCIHFCEKRKLHEDPFLTLNGSRIPISTETKFLGIIFDKKLNFTAHIRYLRDKCFKALNLLKVIGSTKWGADQDTLLKLYRAFVRSKLDYGSFVYGSARESYIKSLEPVANQALRICLGAYRTTPITSLQVMANEPPLHIRRLQLALQYAVKLETMPRNPTWNAMHPARTWRPTDRKRLIPPLYQRISGCMQNIVSQQTKLITFSHPCVPPWTIRKPVVIFNIRTDTKKSDTPDWLYMNKYQEVRDQYKSHTPIFTDGSKEGIRSACATVLPSRTWCQRLPDGASIYTAELQAIINAVTYIQTQQKDKFIIFSDSMSALQALANQDINHALVLKILQKHHHLLQRNKEVIFCWLPSHIGIFGNSEADKSAKSALQLQRITGEIPFSDLRPKITMFTRREWQNSWDMQVHNKLHAIQSSVRIRTAVRPRLSRKDQTVINRLQTGHTYFTHSHLRRGEDPPMCIACQEQITVEHILITCVDFSEVREKYYSAKSLQYLFNSIDPTEILNFLKAIKLYHKI